MENFFIENDNKSFSILSKKGENKVVYSTFEKVLHHYLFEYKNKIFCVMIREDCVFIINLDDNFIFPISSETFANYFKHKGDILVLTKKCNGLSDYIFYDIRKITEGVVEQVFSLPCEKGNIFEIINNTIFYKVCYFNGTEMSYKYDFGQLIF